MRKSKLSVTNNLSILMLCLFLGACGDSSSTDDVTNEDTTEEETPEETTTLTVDAGSNQTVESDATVTLSATVSSTSASIAWTQSSGTDVSLSDATSITATFTAPALSTEETLVFEVSVDDGSNVVTDTISITVEAESTDTTETTTDYVWLINETDARSTYITDETTGEGVLVDVQSVTEETIDGEVYTVVSTQGIPEYDVTITQDIIDSLNARPKADSDFQNGESTTAALGDVIGFGGDVGYISTGDFCETTGGFGYWPKGPACPQADEREVYFPVTPTATTEICENGLGKVGLFVNGSSIYGWGDGMSYNADGSWQNLAPVAEQYDVDICGGHSANGDYHHHFYTSCLATLLGDDGTEHSPLYGYAADGYPIYGPWHSDGVLAVSAWEVRDYDVDSETGCSDSARSCELVDAYDVSQGTVEVTSGPAFVDEVSTLSGNTLVASNGYYYEDYYWNSALTDQGGAHLDKYNGHTDSERGYHYHITLTKDGGTLTPAFPYIVGLRFAGQLADNAVASCASDDGGTGMGPPGGGGPPQ